MWIDEPPGRYVVRAIYENDPNAKLPSLEFPGGDRSTLAKIRTSTACRVESNAIAVEVTRS